MQRWVTPLVGLAVVMLAIALVARSFHPPASRGHVRTSGDAGEDDDGGLLFAFGDGSASFLDDGGPLLLSDLLAAVPRADAGAGGVMPDGTPVPPLPLGAARHVRFGVVLISYVGAQPSAAGGGRPPSRTRPDAYALVSRLLLTAQEDFHAAVQQGDPGSADDVGTIRLGMLEPAPEYVLFALPVNGVGGPVDTPRGYWIVKRLE